jgi:hypothetical protein
MQSRLPVKPRTKRPFLVTLLAGAVLFLAIANGGRAAVALSRWPALSALTLAIPLWLVAGSGVVWGIAWLVECWGLWMLKPRARAAAMILFVLYPIHMLGMVAIFAQGAYERDRLPSAVITAAIAAGLVAFSLSRPGLRQAFDHPPEEPDNDR